MRSYPYGAARALLAFQRGERTELAMVGALLRAEEIENSRILVEFVKALGKGSAKKKSRSSGLSRRGRRR